jgi:hypothetical protein
VKEDSAQARKQAYKEEQYLDQKQGGSHRKGQTDTGEKEDEPEAVNQYDAYRPLLCAAVENNPASLAVPEKLCAWKKVLRS